VRLLDSDLHGGSPRGSMVAVWPKNMLLCRSTAEVVD
jgi:hypothetical protein